MASKSAIVAQWEDTTELENLSGVSLQPTVTYASSTYYPVLTSTYPVLVNSSL